MSLHKKLFYVLLFLLPLNLGKHFEFFWSFVNGILLDYHIPTVYVQDILIVLILTFWIINLIKGREYSKPYLSFFLFFCITVILFISSLSIISATFQYAALYFFIKTSLYLAFSFYVLCTVELPKELDNILHAFLFSCVLLAFLSFAQWINQGSVFDNYLVFGEQPYSISTRGAAIENFFGHAAVGVYGLFRHPNTFAGYLGVFGIVFFCMFLKTKMYRFCISFILMTISLIFTLSYFILFTYFLCLSLALINEMKFKKFVTKPFASLQISPKFNIKTISIMLIVFAFVCSSLMPLVSWPENKSLIRRSDFLTSSYILIKNNWLFGIGINNNVGLIEKHLPQLFDLRFVQPVHNIYLLVFSEIGIVGFFFFVLIISLIFNESFKTHQPYLFLPLVFILITGVFDHFWITMHQTFLLFLLTCVFPLTYNPKE